MVELRHQSGWTLPSVIAVVLLIGATLSSLLQQVWWQERLLKLHAERIRNRAMAEAVMQLALQDLRGVDDATDSIAPATLRHTPGEAGQTHVFFPRTLSEREVLRSRLNGAACRDGICVTDPPPGKPQVLPSSTLAQRRAQTDTARAVTTPDARPAWYWIEVWVSADPAAAPPFDYRFTALVEGAVPGGRVGLETIWQAQPRTDAPSQGAWLSWRWLAP